MKKVPSKIGVKKPQLNKVNININIYNIKYLERRRNKNKTNVK